MEPVCHTSPCYSLSTQPCSEMSVVFSFTMQWHWVPPAVVAFFLTIIRTMSGVRAGPHAEDFLHSDRHPRQQEQPQNGLHRITSVDAAASLPRVLVVAKPGALLKHDRKKRETGKARDDWSTPAEMSAKEIQPERGGEQSVEVRRSCVKVPQSVERTCSKKAIKQKSYACPSDFFPEVCTETEEVQVVDCLKIVKKKVDYDCPQVKLSKLCYKIPHTVPVICKRKASRFVKTPCSKQSRELVCRTKSVPVHDTCFEDESRDVPYSCEKAHTRLECDIDFRVDTGLCTRERTVPITYEYEDTVTEQRCKSVKKLVRKTCSKEVVVDESFPCAKKVLKPKCVQVPETREKMCVEPTVKTESYPCQEVKMQQVASTCSRLATKHDRPPCRSHDMNCEVSRKDTSSLEIYPCEKTVPVSSGKEAFVSGIRGLLTIPTTDGQFGHSQLTPSLRAQVVSLAQRCTTTVSHFSLGADDTYSYVGELNFGISPAAVVREKVSRSL